MLYISTILELGWGGWMICQYWPWQIRSALGLQNSRSEFHLGLEPDINLMDLPSSATLEFHGGMGGWNFHAGWNFYDRSFHALVTFFFLVRQQEECHRNEYQYTLTNFCTDYEGQKVLYKKMIHISHWLNDWFRGKTGFQIYHFWLHYHIPHDFPFPKMYNTCMPPNFCQLWYQWADLLNVYR